MELSGMPPNTSSRKTTEKEGRILQMHQIIWRFLEWLGQHNDCTGMDNKTTLKKFGTTSSRNSKHRDSGQPQQSYDYKEAINEMF